MKNGAGAITVAEKRSGPLDLAWADPTVVINFAISQSAGSRERRLICMHGLRYSDRRYHISDHIGSGGEMAFKQLR